MQDRTVAQSECPVARPQSDRSQPTARRPRLRGSWGSFQRRFGHRRRRGRQLGSRSPPTQTRGLYTRSGTRGIQQWDQLDLLAQPPIQHFGAERPQSSVFGARCSSPHVRAWNISKAAPSKCAQGSQPRRYRFNSPPVIMGTCFNCDSITSSTVAPTSCGIGASISDSHADIKFRNI